MWLESERQVYFDRVVSFSLLFLLEQLCVVDECIFMDVVDVIVMQDKSE